MRLCTAHIAFLPKADINCPSRAHREQIRLMSFGLFKATQIWALHRTQRVINAGIGGDGSSAMRWQTRSSRDHCVRNCAISCSRLTEYPRSDSDRLRPRQRSPKPRCFHRRLWIAHDPTDDFVAVAYVVIVIAAAAALVGADKGEGGLGHVKRRAVTLTWP